MFTGIIEEIGVIQAVTRKGDFYSLKIQAAKVLEGTNTGDSIAVNGVCLTATSIEKSGFFYCDVMSETLSRSSLRDARPGTNVNLERALTLQTRLGGHMVTGHVDEVVNVSRREHVSNAEVFHFKVSKDLLRYIAPKGSIAIDGISLTVVDTTQDSFSVSIIPHTIKNTVLNTKNPGDKVNVEVDVLARYVINYIDKNSSSSSIDWKKIAKVGI